MLYENEKGILVNDKALFQTALYHLSTHIFHLYD